MLKDLDTLIFITNYKNLDHMVHTYDRHHHSTTKPTTSLRVFLFPLNPPPPSTALLDLKPNR